MVHLVSGVVFFCQIFCILSCGLSHLELELLELSHPFWVLSQTHLRLQAFKSHVSSCAQDGISTCLPLLCMPKLKSYSKIRLFRQNITKQWLTSWWHFHRVHIQQPQYFFPTAKHLCRRQVCHPFFWRWQKWIQWRRGNRCWRIHPMDQKWQCIFQTELSQPQLLIHSLP